MLYSHLMFFSSIYNIFSLVIEIKTVYKHINIFSEKKLEHHAGFLDFCFFTY